MLTRIRTKAGTNSLCTLYDWYPAHVCLAENRKEKAKTSEYVARFSLHAWYNMQAAEDMASIAPGLALGLGIGALQKFPKIFQ